MLTFLRYFILTFLLIIVISKKVSSQVYLDYSYHAIAGATVGAFVSNTTQRPLLYTFLSTSFLGISKELIDKKSGKPFDTRDAIATVAGGIITAAIIKTIKRHHALHRIAHSVP